MIAILLIQVFVSGNWIYNVLLIMFFFSIMCLYYIIFSITNILYLPKLQGFSLFGVYFKIENLSL